MTELTQQSQDKKNKTQLVISLIVSEPLVKSVTTKSCHTNKLVDKKQSKLLDKKQSKSLTLITTKLQLL
jgi:hypothetical protein